MTAQANVTHNAPLPNIISASTAHRTSQKTRSMPIAAAAAMNRCRQVSTTITNAILTYSTVPDLGANITSRAWLVIGPGWPYRRAATSSAMRNPRATTLTAAHSMTRDGRPAADLFLPSIRESIRVALDINFQPIYYVSM